MLKFLFILLYLPFSLSAMEKIVGGHLPAEDHPGSFNTVAFIKKADKKIFCTGSIISKKIILTAKHCLVDKGPEDFSVFFGADTNKPENGTVIEPSRLKVRYPVDWEMTFPSFDVAWVELKEDIPSGFRPLPILSEKEQLPKSFDVHLAGHGNSSSVNGKIEAGKKFYTTTELKKYYDNSRFFHILSFEGVEGQGACHGDSGGPAYVKKDGKWFIIGVTNGFDVVLTPKAMRRTSDEEFPYLVDCTKNQNLYSFAGAHGKWIEQTSGHKVLKSTEFNNYDKEEEKTHETIQSWCKAKDFGSARWNFLKLLLDKKVDSMEQDKAVDFYNDCEKIEDYLSALKSIRMDGTKIMSAHYSTAPLHLLNVEELKITEIDSKYIDFGKSHPYLLKRLSLYRMNYETLEPLFASNLFAEYLDVSFTPIMTLRGIENWPLLKGVDLSRTKIENFKPLRLLEYLEDVDISFTSFNDLSILKELNLKKLALGSNRLSKINLEGFESLERLFIGSMTLKDLAFVKDTPNLVELNVNGTKLESLDALNLFPLLRLEALNLTANPIKDLGPLRKMSSLKKLKLFGTPLARGEVNKTEENCPTDGAAVLAKFCSK